MADPIKPVSRLEDASLANSNAIAEARRAASSERQSMAVERSMQRQYRRAVRRNDLQTISVLGSQMTDMGVSRTGGGGIQSSQENNRIASDRAFNRADQLNQASGRGGLVEVDGQGPVDGPAPGDVPNSAVGETETITMNGVDYQMPKKTPRGAPGGSVGQAAADDIERATGGSTARETGLTSSKPSIVGDTRQKFIADLKNSQLFKDGNAKAVERAAARGSKFGISREQIDAYRAGENATPSGIAEAKRKVAERGTTEVLGPELPPEDSPMVSLAKSIQKEQRGISEEIEQGIKGIEKVQTGSFVNSLLDPIVPEPPVYKSPPKQNPTFEPWNASDPKNQEYWSVNPDDVVGKKKPGMRGNPGDDTSDPRYPAMKIRSDARKMLLEADTGTPFSPSMFSVYKENNSRSPRKGRILDDKASNEKFNEMLDHETIWNAARKGVDINEYARARGPKFFDDYQVVKSLFKEANRARTNTAEINRKAANLFPQASR